VKNPSRFWSGVFIALSGGVLLYYGLNLEDTNLNTFASQEVVGALLTFIGFVLLGLGLLRMAVGYFIAPPPPPAEEK
jgi:hypothetical protein